MFTFDRNCNHAKQNIRHLSVHCFALYTVPLIFPNIIIYRKRHSSCLLGMLGEVTPVLLHHLTYFLWHSQLHSETVQPRVVPNYKFYFIFLPGRDSPQRERASWLLRFHDHTQLHATIGRTPLDKWSARRTDLLPVQHSQQTDIHAPGGIRPRNPSKRVATEPRLRPRGQWDRHKIIHYNKHIVVQIMQQPLYQMPRLAAEHYILFSYSRGTQIFKISRNRW